MADVGTTVGGRYRLLREVGRGGFGTVFEATDLQSGRRVAVKLLRTFSGDAVRRFDIEGEAMSRLDHPHCIKVVDRGRGGGDEVFLVTDFVEGVSLREWERSAPPLALRLDVAQQIASALVHAHRHGIVHRDLKPENIIVSDGPNGPWAHVLDFGLAKLTGLHRQDVTKTGGVFGTPGYMSPEQLRGKVAGPESDVYSLGVVIYELIESQPPFAGATRLDTAMGHLMDPVPKLGAHTPGPVVMLVEKMLAKDPRARPTMAHVVRALSGAPHDEVVIDDATGVAVNPWWWWAAGVLACAGIVVALAWPASPRTVQPPGRQPSGLALTKAGPKAESPPDAPPKPAVDVSDVVDAGVHFDGNRPMPDHGTAGCGLPAPRASWTTRRPTREGHSSIGVRFPSDYDPFVPAPVLLVFHDVLFGPEKLLKVESLITPALERDFVVIAISDHLTRDTWLDAGDYDGVVADLDFLAGKLCLDQRRTFLFGFGNGGYAALEVGCRLPQVRAIATAAHRLWLGRALCGEHVWPTLTLEPMDDPFAPRAGGMGCLRNTESLSVAEHERMQRETHGCGRDKHVVSKGAGGTCWTARCKQPLQWCRVDGGRYWGDMGRGAMSRVPLCPSEPSEFDYGATIWTFFDEHDLRE